MVCQSCWTTTESFHDLYKKSKTVQEEFLNSLGKTNERDPVIVLCSSDSKENNSTIEEMVVEINPIKVEQISGKEERR